MKPLFQELNRQIEGEVYGDAMTRQVYSVDASIYQVTPAGVVVAKSVDDVCAAVETCVGAGLSVTARGAATGINGACIGDGVIIDVAKYLTNILEINYEEEYAICEPGVVQDALNRALALNGYCLGPDTSTGARATLGGMLGNNSAGAHSIRFGKMVDHVLEVEMLLGNGERAVFGKVDENAFEVGCARCDQVGEVFRTIRDKVRMNAAEIDAAFPKIQRRVSGYNLDEMIKPFPINLARLIVGSEGTFGIVTKLKVQISKKPKSTVLSVLHFHEFRQAMESMEHILVHHPFSLELMDQHIIELGRKSPSMKGQLDWLDGNPEVLLCAEFDGETVAEAESKQQAFQSQFDRTKMAYHHLKVNQRADQAKVWKVRKAGLGLLMSRRSDSRAVAFLEDVAVAPEQMPDFMEDFTELISAAGKDAGFYGHAGVGCLHVRPMLNLKDEKDVDVMVDMMVDAAVMLKKYGGAVSGEHGDGLTRSWLNERMFGERVYGWFKEVKTAFDPEQMMNPGKIVNAPGPRVNLKGLKSKANYTPKTKYRFGDDGGVNFAVDMCNGNGQCRNPKEAGGLMCPSFQAYGDERHSTRARAHALHAVLNGGMAAKEYTGESMKEILDLCLECKGCTTQCPSQVNMTKLKSEFLYHYQEEHGYLIRTKVFGCIDKLNGMAAKLPSVSNWMMKGPGKLFTEALGIDHRRTMPAYAKQRFSAWFAERQKAGEYLQSSQKVVLFNDTFNEFNTPHIGQSAVAVLERCGYEVIVPERACCGRPLLSKGMLRQAKRYAEKLIATLEPYADKDIAIVGLEPSCIFSLVDEYPDLVDPGKVELARKLAKQCYSFCDFVSERIQPEWFSDSDVEVRLHGHCHQKALRGTSKTMQALKVVAGDRVQELNTGCCGMAGSFGYEKEHYDFSMQVGETRLFPALRELSADAVVVADGMSCRTQIKDGVARKAIHIAEFLAQQLEPVGESGTVI